MELLDLCYDVLMRILEAIDPADLASCAQTCSAFHDFIKENKRLFRSQYLTNWDDPREKPADPEPDWITTVKRVVKCQKTLQSESMEPKRHNFDFVASTVESLIDSASCFRGESKNEAFLKQLFKNPLNLDAVMCRSSLYKRAGSASQQPADTEEDRQLSAKLHCLYGMPLGASGRRIHPYARSHVYDLRNYTLKSAWGPFRQDGSMKVDWEMVEAIMIDLGYNSDISCGRFLPRFKPLWSDPFGGVIKSEQPWSSLPMEPSIPLDLRDPYNISGIWRRIVCFLDYHDLWHFNFHSSPPPSDQPRGPLVKEEAIRHVVMKLKVTQIGPPGRFDNEGLPTVHFKGVSQLAENTWDPDATSTILGKVRLTRGEVHWTTRSIFSGGEERWKSEGIQVGGVASKRGVVGTWFDKDYDHHGPAGPTAFWKVTDQMTSEDFDENDSEDDDE